MDLYTNTLVEDGEHLNVLPRNVKLLIEANC